MWGRGRIRPSKPVSAVAMVVGIIFIGIGVFLVIPAIGPFGVFWTLAAFAITVYYGINVFSEHGVSHQVVEFEGDLKSDSKESDVETRLEKLESLKQKGLLTDAEYKDQRERILKEL
ncbi:MAG: SHOCT domain-containing protein [Sedimentisphaerales bacterium]|nr:SHOCT domain-containing protein [Sedimentisphaerales bacterium]